MNQRTLINTPIAEIADADQRRTAAALRASKIGVFEFEPKTNRAFWDDRVRELWGIPDADVITYETVIAQVHPDDRALHDQNTNAVLDPNGNGRMDMVYRVIPKDGKPMRWIRAVADCFFLDNEPVRLVGTVQDITAEKTAEEQNQLLFYELEHRVKNTLTVAIGVVELSRKGARDLDEYCDAIEGRLRSLAASHDLFRKTEWSSVDLRELIARAAVPFVGTSSPKIHIVGDDLRIPSHNVMLTTMAIHELLTNATKYGALRHPDGKVEISVDVVDGMARITWTEHGNSGGDTDPESTRSGFGSLLLSRMFPAELGGRATRNFKDGNLVFCVEMPVKEGVHI